MTAASQKQFSMTKLGLAALIIFGAGIGVGYYIHSDTEKIPLGEEHREFNTKYHFISPLLACGDENFSRTSNSTSIRLEEGVAALINAKKNDGTLSDAAVYFRALNAGPWFGVNESALFTPGSLLKVPLILSVYQREEKEPGFLQNTFEFEGGIVPATEYFRSEEIKPGGVYSVEDLVRATLVHSDNIAATLLTQLISPEELTDSYSQLGITEPTMGNDYEMTVRTYASFFRILYNATYIDHDASEHLLSMLSEATFDKGLVAGVPADVRVAHKFGERQVNGGATKQLHDCGIVYNGNQPYLLCIMLRGNDFDALAGVIKEISAYVYSQVGVKNVPMKI